MIDLYPFYAKQAYLLDEGHSAEWASTFTTDGVFDSPSYKNPARGFEQLKAIGDSYVESGIQRRLKSRHVASNIWVESATSVYAIVRGYFLIVETAENGVSISRATQFIDTLSINEEQVLVSERKMNVDR